MTQNDVAPTVHSTGGGTRVLVVDDHAESVVTIGRLLQTQGYDVCVELTGLDAVETASVFRPEIAVIDLSLPLLDGFDVAERLRTNPETQNALLIALTGWATEDVGDRAKAAGFDLVLMKPVRVVTLLWALANHSAMHPTAAPAPTPNP